MCQFPTPWLLWQTKIFGFEQQLLSRLAICIAAAPIRKDEKCRCPQADENSKALCMRLRFCCGAAGEEPNCNGSGNGGKAKHEAKITELNVL